MTSILAALFFLVFPSEAPVIRLDEVYIQGNVRRPPIVELEASKLEQKVEESALKSLLRLEKKLVKPAESKDLPR